MKVKTSIKAGRVSSNHNTIRRQGSESQIRLELSRLDLQHARKI